MYVLIYYQTCRIIYIIQVTVLYYIGYCITLYRLLYYIIQVTVIHYIGYCIILYWLLYYIIQVTVLHYIGYCITLYRILYYIIQVTIPFKSWSIKSLQYMARLCILSESIKHSYIILYSLLCLYLSQHYLMKEVFLLNMKNHLLIFTFQLEESELFRDYFLTFVDRWMDGWMNEWMDG